VCSAAVVSTEQNAQNTTSLGWQCLLQRRCTLKEDNIRRKFRRGCESAARLSRSATLWCVCVSVECAELKTHGRLQCFVFMEKMEEEYGKVCNNINKQANVKTNSARWRRNTHLGERFPTSSAHEAALLAARTDLIQEEHDIQSCGNTRRKPCCCDRGLLFLSPSLTLLCSVDGKDSRTTSQSVA
jgi:hypothetical protein